MLQSISTSTWKYWQENCLVAETITLSVIYQTKDVAGIVPKRAFTRQEEIAEFRSLIASKVRQG